MKKDLVIIGAGGDGRNVAEILEDSTSQWNLLGFLDDDPTKIGTTINRVSVLGTTRDITKYKGCYFLVLVGNPQTLFKKKKLINELEISQNQLATVIHPSAMISKYADVGNGTVVLGGATIMANATIGENTYIASNVNIGHDTKIGGYSFIAPLSGIPGN